ncbi:MAG: 1-acyl-sn-glycerol-3-phosphate acyltransferase, partial [Gemmatimonadetes bacterium]|nr:1-acyl-sn-glycerol-3-phosphate acyltransferase [Gemmatimonadota bacterium]
RAGAILAFNHIAFLDPFAAAYAVHLAGRRPRFLAKGELFDDKRVAWILKGAGQIPVRRGTPEAPMAVRMTSTTTTAWVASVISTPNAWARNRTVTPSNRAVPFMFIVAPRGSTKPATSRGTPRPWVAVRIVVGRVALELDVENAVTMSVRIRL